jgi:hypothetical protein
MVLGPTERNQGLSPLVHPERWCLPDLLRLFITGAVADLGQR